MYAYICIYIHIDVYSYIHVYTTYKYAYLAGRGGVEAGVFVRLLHSPLGVEVVGPRQPRHLSCHLEGFEVWRSWW